MKYSVAILTLCFGLVLGRYSDIHFPTAREHLKQACTEYHVNYEDMLKIAYVESTFKLNAFNTNRNGTVDVGLFQINSIHHNDCLSSGYDVYTVRGNIYCAVSLVARLKKYEAIDKYWLGRYHSKTKAKKLAYITKLGRVKL